MAKKLNIQTRLVNMTPPKPKAREEVQKRKLGLMTRVKNHPRSFRFSDDSWEKFKDLVENINKLSRRKVTETMVIQALIHMGAQAKAQKVLNCIKTIV